MACIAHANRHVAHLWLSLLARSACCSVSSFGSFVFWLSGRFWTPTRTLGALRFRRRREPAMLLPLLLPPLLLLLRLPGRRRRGPRALGYGVVPRVWAGSQRNEDICAALLTGVGVIMPRRVPRRGGGRRKWCTLLACLPALVVQRWCK